MNPAPVDDEAAAKADGDGAMRSAKVHGARRNAVEESHRFQSRVLGWREYRRRGVRMRDDGRVHGFQRRDVVGGIGYRAASVRIWNA